MKLDEVSAFYQEALAIHDILGMFVDARHIFVSRDDAGDLYVVAKEGERHAAVRVGAMPGTSRETFELEWAGVVEAYNAASQEDRKELLERSKARDKAVNIVAGMVAQGFTVTNSGARWS